MDHKDTTVGKWRDLELRTRGQNGWETELIKGRKETSTKGLSIV